MLFYKNELIGFVAFEEHGAYYYESRYGTWEWIWEGEIKNNWHLVCPD